MIAYLLAAKSLNDLPAYSKAARLGAKDLTLILGLSALVFVGIVLWARFIRGPRKHPDEDNTPSLAAPPSETEDGRERVRKKRRVRRRDHRQRNPTLSQTGGLPPPRDPQESPSV